MTERLEQFLISHSSFLTPKGERSADGLVALGGGDAQVGADGGVVLLHELGGVLDGHGGDVGGAALCV